MIFLVFTELKLTIFGLMEYINEYMLLEIHSSTEVQESYCKSTQNGGDVLIEFGLYAEDCLFDLAQDNYLVHVKIADSYFEKYNEAFFSIIEKQKICCHTQSKLLQLIECKLTGLPRKLFLESSVLFLLFQTQQNNLIFQLECDSCEIINKETDLDKMKQAKDFILAHLSENITIPVIANHVATNQCYLKKGFKEAFGQTIYECVQENRMIKAKHLLESGETSIAEVAQRVGYSSRSSFSQAYKNYFGLSPKMHIQNI